MSDFWTFNANTPGGQWAYVTVSWLLLTATYAGYLVVLNRRFRRLQEEVATSTEN
jgi:hypothetical protein